MSNSDLDIGRKNFFVRESFKIFVKVGTFFGNRCFFEKGLFTFYADFNNRAPLR